MNRYYVYVITLMIMSLPLCAEQKIFLSASVNKNRLTVQPTDYLKQTFLNNEDFVVTYDRDISYVPQTVLTIPYIMCMSPLLWLSGKSYTIKGMDYDTYYALKEIKKVFKTFYPELSWEGTLTAEHLTKNTPPHHTDRVALLFSAGLDCVSSSLVLYGTEQLLITNQGVDMPLKNPKLFENVKEQCRFFAKNYTYDNGFISFNFCTILNYRYLKVFSPTITKWWWLDSVVDALNHTGVTAPLLYAEGYTKLTIAASHTVDHPYPYGSHPLIDNRIAFAGITVHHDQEELDRCQKINLVQSASQTFDKPIPQLRVCWTDKLGNNCLSCEKCLRTLNNIIVTGNIPLDYGFTISEKEVMHKTREFLEKDPINTAKLFWEWQVIQKHARTLLKNTDLSQDDREYFTWLSTIKLDGQHAEQIHKDDQKKSYFAWLWNQRHTA